ncbi:MAG: hypothetical protein EOP06_17560 [Proteobacteria bacterium]|nr:MAG: hypothetical protein EOP06_17560 [Pseudomonadota bacterium]
MIPLSRLLTSLSASTIFLLLALPALASGNPEILPSPYPFGSAAFVEPRIRTYASAPKTLALVLNIGSVERGGIRPYVYMLGDTISDATHNIVSRAGKPVGRLILPEGKLAVAGPSLNGSSMFTFDTYVGDTLDNVIYSANPASRAPTGIDNKLNFIVTGPNGPIEVLAVARHTQPVETAIFGSLHKSSQLPNSHGSSLRPS